MLSMQPLRVLCRTALNFLCFHSVLQMIMLGLTIKIRKGHGKYLSAIGEVLCFFHHTIPPACPEQSTCPQSTTCRPLPSLNCTQSTQHASATKSASPKTDSTAINLLHAGAANRADSSVCGAGGARHRVGYVDVKQCQQSIPTRMNLMETLRVCLCTSMQGVHVHHAASLGASGPHSHTMYTMSVTHVLLFVVPPLADSEQTLTISNTEFANLWRRAVHHNPFVQAFMLNFGAIGKSCNCR